MSYTLARSTNDACNLIVAVDWLRDNVNANFNSGVATTSMNRGKKQAGLGKKEREKMAKGLLQCEAIVRQVGDTC